MDHQIPSEDVVRSFLDWAWDQWKDFRHWNPPDKQLQPAGSESARDDQRLLFPLRSDALFLIGIRPQAGSVRVGLVTTNRWISEQIEQAVLDSGASMTEFLEDEMEADDDLEHPMLHYHDSGEFYFISEIPFENLESPELYDHVGAYFKGYVIALEGRLTED